MGSISTMRMPVDATMTRRKGLDPNAPYPGIVIDDNDPDELCRIRVRVEKIFDHIPDDDLPWAIPVFPHPEGLLGGNRTERTGISHVPRKGNKVHLRFPSGDPSTPVWGGMPIDKKNMLPEMSVHYPFRIVHKLGNGMYYIIDTKTNEIFINNPGDMDVTVLGDVDLTVMGNLTRRITDRKGDIPSYLLNAPDTVLNALGAKPAKQIPFEGLLKKTRAGNYHTLVRGDQTTMVDGDVFHRVKGNYTIKCDKVVYTDAGMEVKERAPKINMN